MVHFLHVPGWLPKSRRNRTNPSLFLHTGNVPHFGKDRTVLELKLHVKSLPQPLDDTHSNPFIYHSGHRRHVLRILNELPERRMNPFKISGECSRRQHRTPRVPNPQSAGQLRSYVQVSSCKSTLQMSACSASQEVEHTSFNSSLLTPFIRPSHYRHIFLASKVAHGTGKKVCWLVKHFHRTRQKTEPANVFHAILGSMKLPPVWLM